MTSVTFGRSSEVQAAPTLQSSVQLPADTEWTPAPLPSQLSLVKAMLTVALLMLLGFALLSVI